MYCVSNNNHNKNHLPYKIYNCLCLHYHRHNITTNTTENATITSITIRCNFFSFYTLSLVPGAVIKFNQAFQLSLVFVNLLAGITWTNYDSQIHTITSGSTGSPSEGQIFDSGILSPGATFSVTLVQSRIFSYHCTFHPQMVGTVVVS